MMSMTVAELLVQTLDQIGAHQVFGIVGDALNPFTDAIRRQEVVRWIGVRHEEGAALAATGADFTSMTGYISGTLTDPEGIRQLLDSARESIGIAEQLNCPSLNLHGTGLGEGGLPVQPVSQTTGRMWLSACKTLAKIARLGEDADRVFLLENLNTEVDHPGTPFARADFEAFSRVGAAPTLSFDIRFFMADGSIAQSATT